MYTYKCIMCMYLKLKSLNSAQNANNQEYAAENSTGNIKQH